MLIYCSMFQYDTKFPMLILANYKIFLQIQVGMYILFFVLYIAMLALRYEIYTVTCSILSRSMSGGNRIIRCASIKKCEFVLDLIRYSIESSLSFFFNNGRYNSFFYNINLGK